MNVPAYGNEYFGNAVDLREMYDLRKSQTFTELTHVNTHIVYYMYRWANASKFHVPLPD